MNLSQLFLAAKDHLAMTPDEERHDRKTEFICHAIERAADDERQLMQKAIDIIDDRLAHRTVTHWLIAVVGVTEKQLDEGYPMLPENYGYARPRVQQFRAAWLDHLAAEFKE